MSRPLLTSVCVALLIASGGCAGTPDFRDDAPRRPLHREHDARGSNLRLKGPLLSVPDVVRRDARESSPYLLKPLDPIFISLRGIPRPEQIEDKIDEEGRINLPYIGSLRAAGKSTFQLEAAIERAYVDQQIYRRVSVNVVVPAQSYFVRGEVKKPGRYALVSGVTLVQAIATAGGYTEYANPKKSKLIRGGQTLLKNLVALERSPQRDEDIESGDVIVVPRSVF